MKKLLIIVLMAVLVPASAMAMQGMEHGKKDMEHSKKDMDHDDKKDMDHDSKKDMDHDDKKDMDHDDKKDMDHDDKKDMDHDGKKMKKGMGHGGGMGMDGVVMLQEEVVDGVKGAAHLMDHKDGQMLMLMFTDEASGKMLSEGRVAVKIEGPDEKVSEALKLKKSKGMFGVPVSFDQKGVYRFKVGTKLADGTKRTYNFQHEN